MKEWLAPQISEHWPINSPGRFTFRNSWFNRPGNASILIPSDGMVQEWITSVEDKINRIDVLLGTTILDDVFNNRISFDFSRKASISLLMKSEYS
jgi:hypothetical protein